MMENEKGEKMDLEEFQKIFHLKCEENAIKMDREKSELFYRYMKLVLEWNKRINVTAIIDEDKFIVKHFLDSLLVTRVWEPSTRLLDIGTGAGFPGIPLKLYCPETEVCLIDAVNKKVTVLKDVIEKLKLERIEALHIRAEELAKDLNYREGFDVVTTRAVSSLATISEYMLPFVKVGGSAICMKGPNIEQELEEAKKAIKVLGGEIYKIEKFKINEELNRNLIVIKKVKKTEQKYPRGQGKPMKEPIQ